MHFCSDDLTGASVRLSGTPNDDQSVWLGVILAPEHGVLPIRLNAVSEHVPSPGAEVLVHGQKGGWAFDFVGKVADYALDPTPTVLLSAPERIEARSLRRFVRAAFHASGTCRWYAVDSSEPNAVQECVILDIGKGGVAVAAKAPPQGKHLVQLAFAIPGNVSVETECSRRHAESMSFEVDTVRIGLEFIMISPQAQKAVGLFATDAQRRGSSSMKDEGQ